MAKTMVRIDAATIPRPTQNGLEILAGFLSARLSPIGFVSGPEYDKYLAALEMLNARSTDLTVVSAELLWHLFDAQAISIHADENDVMPSLIETLEYAIATVRDRLMLALALALVDPSSMQLNQVIERLDGEHVINFPFELPDVESE